MNFDFPFHFNGWGRTATTDNLNHHIRNLIEQLLFTSPGERVNRPDFGTGLLSLVFAPNRPELATALQFTILAAIQRWLGDLVEVETVEVTSEDAKLRVLLSYKVRPTGEQLTAIFERSVP